MITLKIKSYNSENVLLFINMIKEKVKSLKCTSIRRLSRLPKRSKKITILKSPHVNSKSKEQFIFNIHSCTLKIHTSNKESLIELLKEVAPSQLGMEMKVT